MDVVLPATAASDIGGHYSRPDLLRLLVDRRPLDRLVDRQEATLSAKDEAPMESKREAKNQLAVVADEVPPRSTVSTYPEPFFSRMVKRQKRQLGEVFGLRNFGVNLTTLLPGGESALMHRHSKQDEFVFVLKGTPTLVTDQGEQALRPGMCAGFPANGLAHHLVNRRQHDVVFLEIGDRSKEDEGSYPHDDLRVLQGPDGTWRFFHKDGRPY